VNETLLERTEIMQTTFRTTLAALAIAAASVAPAAAQGFSQLAAAAGLTPAQAAGLSLDEIAAYKNNIAVSKPDRQTMPTRGAASVQVFARNADAARIDVVRHAQLIGAAGLTPDQARGLTLGEVVAIKNNIAVSVPDRQTVRSASGQDVQVSARNPSGTTIDPAAHRQLIAAAGLSPAGARGMTVGQVVAIKNNIAVSGPDRQSVGRF
jgi:hypothetical protein